MAMGPPGDPDRTDTRTQPPVTPATATAGWASRPVMPPDPAPRPEDRPIVPTDPSPDPPSSPGRSLPVTGWWLLTAVAVTMALMTFALPAWTASLTTPRVVLLGGGSSLSVLILAGDARVVIAAGDDPAAFGRAFDQATAITSHRIDLLVVAATGKGLAVPADLAADRSVGEVVRLGAPHPGRETGDLPDGLPQLPPLARIEIAPGVTAMIETVEILDPDDGGDFDLAWRAEIRSGAGTVTVLSDMEHAGAFPPLTSRGVLVAAGGGDLSDLLPSPAGTLVVNADDVTGSEVRADLPPLLTSELPTIRVHPGTAVTLLLTGDGVQLPDEDVVMVEPADGAVTP